MASQVSSKKAEKLERKRRKAMRRLGANRHNIGKIVEQIRADGDVDMTDKVAVARAVEAELQYKALGDPKFDWGAVDWEKIFELIMRIIEAILKFV